MKQTEALKLAQDLEQYADMVENGELISPDEMNCASIMRLAAEALTEQSNEQEYQGSDAAKATHMMDLYTALGVKFGEDPFAVIAKMRDAHLEQEPVAFLTNHRQRRNVQIKPEAFVWMPTTTDWEVPLYTAPPQRKPLTDEEYSALAEQYTGADGLDCVDYGRAIARHYGIKE